MRQRDFHVGDRVRRRNEKIILLPDLRKNCYLAFNGRGELGGGGGEVAM